jgi:MoaA/NifB/PqqE/SkfB family radical SAM enzyme
MDRSSVSEIIHHAAHAGLKVLVIAGEGEPLLAPDFRYVVKEASDSGLVPYVFTNGSRLNPNMVTFLASNHASLIIGLDSLDPTRYAKLTGGGRLDHVLNNLKHARQVYAALIKEDCKTRFVSLAINTVVTSLNVNGIEAIRQFCDDDIAFVCNRPTRIGLAERNWQMLYGDIPTNVEVDNVVGQMAMECGPLGSTPDGKWCAYMRHGISIGPDGSILTCAYSLETTGCYGKFSDGNCQEANRQVMESVEEFYRHYGHSRCILRHPQYAMFASRLRQSISTSV